MNHVGSDILLEQALQSLHDAIKTGDVRANDITDMIASKRTLRAPQKHGISLGARVPEREVVECAFCSGLGRTLLSRKPCPVCKGAKSIEIPIGYVECGPCSGRGRAVLDTDPCQACQGIGQVPVPRY